MIIGLQVHVKKPELQALMSVVNIILCSMYYKGIHIPETVQ